MCHFLQNCEDFKKEVSQMENILRLLGAELQMTPKCHPEIVGQGIEYAWGYSNLCFCLHFNDSESANLENIYKGRVEQGCNHNDSNEKVCTKS